MFKQSFAIASLTPHERASCQTSETLYVLVPAILLLLFTTQMCRNFSMKCQEIECLDIDKINKGDVLFTVTHCLPYLCEINMVGCLETE